MGDGLCGGGGQESKQKSEGDPGLAGVGQRREACLGVWYRRK